MKLKFILPATVAAPAFTTTAYADDKKRDRRDQRPQAFSAETYGAGAVDVQRRRARAAVIAGGRVEGPRQQRPLDRRRLWRDDARRHDPVELGFEVQGEGPAARLRSRSPVLRPE